MPIGGKEVKNGKLRRIDGVMVLSLNGSAYERGVAHGELLGAQIMDFLQFFLLEDMFPSPVAYESSFLPALRAKAALTPQFELSVRGIIEAQR